MLIKDLDRTEEEKAYFEAFSQKKSGILILAGPNGTGKTFSAKAIAGNFKHGRYDSQEWDAVIFLKQPEIHIKWAESFNVPGGTLYLTKQFYNCKLLVIDDLGTRKPSDGLMDFLYTIIDYRHENRDSLATIITTNLTSKKIREDFGEAFSSRLLCGKSFKIEGVDRRFLSEF